MSQNLYFKLHKSHEYKHKHILRIAWNWFLAIKTPRFLPIFYHWHEQYDEEQKVKKSLHVHQSGIVKKKWETSIGKIGFQITKTSLENL